VRRRDRSTHNRGEPQYLLFVIRRKSAEQAGYLFPHCPDPGRISASEKHPTTVPRWDGFFLYQIVEKPEKILLRAGKYASRIAPADQFLRYLPMSGMAHPLLAVSLSLSTLIREEVHIMFRLALVALVVPLIFLLLVAAAYG